MNLTAHHLATIFILAVGSTPSAFGQTPDRVTPKPKDPIPYAYTQPSVNGKLVFVMLPPADADMTKQEAAYRDQTNRLTRAYASSGVYRKGESTPIWTYPGPFAFDSFLSNDGRHLIIIHGQSWFTAAFPMAARLPPADELSQLDGPAVSFYQDGTLLKTYTVRDLVGDPANLRNSISHIQWRAGEGLVDDRGVFNLFTQDGQRCRFDITTGNLIEKRTVDYTNQKIVFGIIFGIVAVAVLFAIRWLVRGPTPELASAR